MDLLATLGIATLPAVLTMIYTHVRFKNEQERHNADMMSERAARHFLSNPNFKARTFKTLKKHLGGWDNDEDGLRRILVRAGAVRSFRTADDGSKEELWELLGRDWKVQQGYHD